MAREGHRIGVDQIDILKSIQPPVEPVIRLIPYDRISIFTNIDDRVTARKHPSVFPIAQLLPF